MIFNKNIGLFLISIFVLSACDTAEDEPVPNSSDVSFTTVSPLGENVNDSAALDAGPEVSYDGLELYFHSDRTGDLDIYVSKRASTADSWGPAESLSASINSSENDKDASISKDGLTLVIASDRTGTAGGYDLYLSTRLSVNDPWSLPASLGNVVNSDLNESGADLNADGRLLYFHSDRTGADALGFSSLGGDDIYASNRVAVGSAWGAPVNLGTNVNSTGDDAAPEAASDSLTLYFHSTRPGGAGSHSIWSATRATVNDIWGVPALVPAPVNSAAKDVGPGLSTNWKTLYFASDFGGNTNIWIAEP